MVYPGTIILIYDKSIIQIMKEEQSNDILPGKIQLPVMFCFKFGNLFRKDTG